MEPGAASRQFDHGEILDLDVERLREDFRLLRLDRGVSQFDVATLLKVSQATISSFEQGKHDRIRSRTLRGIHEIVSFWKEESAGHRAKTSRNRSVVISAGTGRNTGQPCGECGAKIPALLPEPRYCPFCGIPLGRKCGCGHPVQKPEAKSCSVCGLGLDGKSGESNLPQDATLRSALQNTLDRYFDRGDLVDFILSELREKLQLDTPRQ